jgi:hypothetical protein
MPVFYFWETSVYLGIDFLITQEPKVYVAEVNVDSPVAPMSMISPTSFTSGSTLIFSTD